MGKLDGKTVLVTGASRGIEAEIATHLFEEPGALVEVARLAREWFERYLVPAETRMPEAGTP